MWVVSTNPLATIMAGGAMAIASAPRVATGVTAAVGGGTAAVGGGAAAVVLDMALDMAADMAADVGRPPYREAAVDTAVDTAVVTAAVAITEDHQRQRKRPSLRDGGERGTGQAADQ